MSAFPPEIERRGDVVVVSPGEDLDIATADAFGARVLAAVPNRAAGAVIDLSRVRYIDSAGIRTLFTVAERLGQRRQALRVVARPDGAVGRILDIVGFGATVPMDESVTAAVGSIEAAAAAG